MFAEALEDILRDRCTPAVVRAIEAGDDPMLLWSAIAEAGFLELLAPESAGGAGLPLDEFFEVALLLGRYAVPLPLAQSMAARALLPEGACPAAMLTFAPGLRREADGWCCPQVPFGAIATAVLADDGDALLLFDCQDAQRLPTGVAHSQAAGLRFTAEPQRFARDGQALRAWGAALHAALIAGAMARAFEMTLQYGNERSQFGKSIGKFQAIQHQLSVMAEQVAASRLAARAAFGAGTAPGLLQAALAKARTSEAVVPVAATAHAVHGAIGVTAEYDLQLYTRRLQEWRLAHGSEAHWHPVIGQALLDSGAPVADFIRDLAAA
ncbi:acyl-CoA dehydrogenase [Xylophilus sp. GOD-11R]|uniref:acyl-CoA dehydrogenase n=1 Tax=Xylophilus sp. GOD-11R TaxID=3089814 RepID=UPI00298C4ED5|nr:acyl-CoA dehydrogenase [Xylophilus sp. GOD-11R]WPB58395.1 acyl-CoA dehydrogenase [Xylophilus sp. GOD-11R]